MSRGSVTINGVRVDLDKIARENQQNEAEESETAKAYDFEADRLEVQGAAFDKINIQPHDSNKIEVKVTGLQSDVDAVEVREEDGTVMIDSDSKSKGGISIGGIHIGRTNVQINSGKARVTNIGNMISFGNGNTVISSNGSNINIQTDDSASCTLEVKVPIGADIELDVEGREVVIGDTNGDLTIDSSGATQFFVGAIMSLDFDASGAVTGKIQRVDGNVNIDLSGGSSIDIGEGEIDKLDVDVSGAGNARVRCTAQRAKLDASGAGHIHVRHVVKKPRQDRSGAASIQIDSIG